MGEHLGQFVIGRIVRRRHQEGVAVQILHDPQRRRVFLHRTVGQLDADGADMNVERGVDGIIRLAAAQRMRNCLGGGCGTVDRDDAVAIGVVERHLRHLAVKRIRRGAEGHPRGRGISAVRALGGLVEVHIGQFAQIDHAFGRAAAAII
ncbi:hypothetical protein QWZ10_06695 [Paracoccus cavernae]|uniref:Uncharacterized protein n=1 Tax=Paracoccus cavernae TaxID=1571207 RepID=A0ABT8D5M8_9RHOB|nr:hypothetical protein [Paracoccus cavernae]